MKRCYYTYIITNHKKTVLYIGVTNNLIQRLTEHYINSGNPNRFAGRYHCYYLLYFEIFQFIKDAIKREKELKGWKRIKKERLIESKNPDWNFLNEQIMDWPPPIDSTHR